MICDRRGGAVLHFIVADSPRSDGHIRGDSDRLGVVSSVPDDLESRHSRSHADSCGSTLLAVGLEVGLELLLGRPNGPRGGVAGRWALHLSSSHRSTMRGHSRRELLAVHS